VGKLLNEKKGKTIKIKKQERYDNIKRKKYKLRKFNFLAEMQPFPENYDVQRSKLKQWYK
jgi:hypothetical protein